MKKLKELLLPIYIVLNMLFILVCSYLIIIKKFNMWRLSKSYIVLEIINLIILIILFIMRKIKKKKVMNIIDLFTLLIILFGIIATIYAVDVKSSLFGYNGRYEGLFSILYYLSLVQLASFVDKKYKKVVIYSLLFCGAVECGYAILQSTQWLPVVTQWNRHKPWATGFITNPNFFGSLMTLCLLYSVGLYFDSEKKYVQIINLILSFIFMIGVLISNSLSAIVGCLCVFFYLLIYIVKHKKYIKLIVLICVLSLTLIFMQVQDSTTLMYDLNRFKNQTIEISKGHIEENYGSSRIFIWKNTLKRVPRYLIHGVGIDNFYYAFGKKPLMKDRWFFDKAHNEYLQILICEGIFALISYLLFFGTITLRAMKDSKDNKELYLLLPIMGYLIQAFFNISVIEVAPFFYIALGLAISRDTSYKCIYDNSIDTRIKYFIKNKRRLNLKNPVLFSDKIVYLNIFEDKHKITDVNIKEDIDLKYRLYCIDGKVEAILFSYDDKKYKFYSPKWDELDYIKDKYKLDKKVSKPNYLNKLISYAEEKAKTRFVRVDLYYIKGKIELERFEYVPIDKIYNKSFEVEMGKKIVFNRIGVVGHFGGDKLYLDGQTIKTKEVSNYLEDYFNISINKYDTYKNNRNPFKILNKTINLLKYNDDVVIILANRGYMVIAPILVLFNKIYKRRIYDIVIGGSRYNIYKNNNLITKVSKKIDTIFVETKQLKEEYNKKGFNNVEVLSNFKVLKKFSNKEKHDKFRLCVFSRIIKEKGIEDAIEAVKLANKKAKKDIFVLDIYGIVIKDYKKEFDKIISTCPDYIKYKGIVNYNESVDKLKDYDAMLFLTYYKNEGFAGTLIDAFYSGLPVIATDWHNNFEVLKDNYTGLKVSVSSPKEVAEQIYKLYKDKDLLDEMSLNCLKESNKYSPDKVMEVLVNKIKRQ